MALTTTDENLTEALVYFQYQRKYLEMFLEDRCVPISNNLHEANIKLFATERLLFADMPKGCDSKHNGIVSITNGNQLY